MSGQWTPVEELVTGGDIKEIWRDGSVPGHDLGAGYTVHPPCEKSLSYTEFVFFSEFCYTSTNIYNMYKKISGPNFYIPQERHSFQKSAFAKPTISPLCGHSDHKGMAVELPDLGVSGHLSGHIPVVLFKLSEQELLSLYPTHGPLILMVP